MKFSYTFTVRHDKKNDPDGYELREKRGEITTMHLDREPYEAVVEADGNSFHILFGSQAYGNFLCIPNWNLGFELADLQDEFWNMESILHARTSLTRDDAEALVTALSLLDDCIGSISEQNR